MKGLVCFVVGEKKSSYFGTIYLRSFNIASLEEASKLIGLMVENIYSTIKDGTLSVHFQIQKGLEVVIDLVEVDYTYEG